MDNLQAGEIKNDFKTIFQVLKDELTALTKAIDEDDSFAQIKAYHGNTLFDPILRRQGFTIIELTDRPKKMFLKIWINLLRLVFRKEQKKNRNLRIPKEFWISKEHLLKDYTTK